jgi:hypothetical protein
MAPAQNQYQLLVHTQTCLDYDLIFWRSDGYRPPTHHWQYAYLETTYQLDLLTAHQLHITLVALQT